MTVFAALLYLTSAGSMTNIQLVRLYFALRGTITPPEDVVIIAIDDRSYGELNAPTTYPLPRRYLASVSEVIADANPRVFFADLKFPDDREYDAESDDRIVTAFARMPTTIWTGREDNKPETIPLPSGSHFRRAAKMELDMFIEGSHGYLFGAGNRRSSEISFPSYTPITRESPVKLKEMLRLRSPICHALVELGGYSIKPPAASSFINFYGPSKTIPYISFVDLISSDTQALQEKIRGKVVLMGYLSKQYMKGILNRDEFFVPSDKNGMFGVEIHGHLIANLIHNHTITRMDLLDELIFVGVAIFLFAAAALRKPTPSVIGFILLTPLVLLAIGYFSFVYFRFFIPGIPIITFMSYLITAPSIIHFLLRSQRFNNYLNKQLKIETEQEI
ncbi:CHASE2 domain-containing protein [Pirellulaceae bacterium SH449]